MIIIMYLLTKMRDVCCYLLPKLMLRAQVKTYSSDTVHVCHEIHFYEQNFTSLNFSAIALVRAQSILKIYVLSDK